MGIWIIERRERLKSGRWGKWEAVEVTKHFYKRERVDFLREVSEWNGRSLRLQHRAARYVRAKARE